MEKIRKDKYFSQLTAKQKDISSRVYLYARLNLFGLDKGLINAILYNMDFEKLISIKDEIRGTKMFYSEKLACYIPLNINELLKTSN